MIEAQTKNLSTKLTGSKSNIAQTLIACNKITNRHATLSGGPGISKNFMGSDAELHHNLDLPMAADLAQDQKSDYPVEGRNLHLLCQMIGSNC